MSQPLSLNMTQNSFIFIFYVYTNRKNLPCKNIKCRSKRLLKKSISIGFRAQDYYKAVLKSSDGEFFRNANWDKYTSDLIIRSFHSQRNGVPRAYYLSELLRLRDSRVSLCGTWTASFGPMFLVFMPLCVFVMKKNSQIFQLCWSGCMSSSRSDPNEKTKAVNFLPKLWTDKCIIRCL